METATGLVRRITFHNPDNGYTIAQVEPETKGKQSPEGITVVGVIIGIAEGQTVEVSGTWEDHPKFGRQLKIESCRAVFPTTEEGIRRFLSSGLVKGVGKKSAERIVAHFGRDTLKVLDEHPRRLLEVPGLGRKRAGMLTRAWSGQRRMRDAMVFLQSHGVGSAASVKIFQKYEQEAIVKVREDPYRLQRDIDGIGFVTADAVASQLGIARDAPQRIQAGIGYLLESAAGEGNVFLPQAEVVEKGSELLQVDPGLFPARPWRPSRRTGRSSATRSAASSRTSTTPRCGSPPPWNGCCGPMEPGLSSAKIQKRSWISAPVSTGRSRPP